MFKKQVKKVKVEEAVEAVDNTAPEKEKIEIDPELEIKVNELEMFNSIAQRHGIHRLGQAHRMLENAKRELKVLNA